MAYNGRRSENNIKCVTHDNLRWKNQTTRYILPRHWLCQWFSQFHSCGTYSVLSRSHLVGWLTGRHPSGKKLSWVCVRVSRVLSFACHLHLLHQNTVWMLNVKDNQSQLCQSLLWKTQITSSPGKCTLKLVYMCVVHTYEYV